MEEEVVVGLLVVVAVATEALRMEVVVTGVAVVMGVVPPVVATTTDWALASARLTSKRPNWYLSKRTFILNTQTLPNGLNKRLMPGELPSRSLLLVPESPNPASRSKKHPCRNMF